MMDLQSRTQRNSVSVPASRINAPQTTRPTEGGSPVNININSGTGAICKCQNLIYFLKSELICSTLAYIDEDGPDMRYQNFQEQA